MAVEVVQREQLDVRQLLRRSACSEADGAAMIATTSAASIRTVFLIFIPFLSP